MFHDFAYRLQESVPNKSASKKKSDLSWIDRLEEIDAVLDDF